MEYKIFKLLWEEMGANKVVEGLLKEIDTLKAIIKKQQKDVKKLNH